MNPARILALLVLLLAPVAQTGAAPVRDQHVEVELVPSVAAIVPGQTFTVALRINHDDHWHTYWQNPGDAGLATELVWKLPEGFTAGPIRWPVPDITDTSGLKTYGYGGVIHLLVDIAAPATLRPGTNVTLAATATWLMCKEACIPGEAEVALELSVAIDAGTDPKWSTDIAAARAALPPPATDLALKAWRSGKDITLVIDAARDLNPGARDLYFFDNQGFVEAGIEQTSQRSQRQVRIDLVETDYAKQPAKLSGLLRANGGWFAGGAEVFEVSFDVVDGAPPAVAGTTGSAADGAATGLAKVLVFAFLGGLILNLMPCVFPVIGIKIMGFVNQAGEARGRVVMHGLVFTAGVLVSFWVLSGLLLVLRSGGAELGWGFQLQSPVFVYVLTVLLLVFGLSMSGVFEIGGSLIGVGSGLQAKSGFGGTFFSGVLATVVATPCAAPMLGPALGAALSLPPFESVLTFTVIALGLAAPYMLLSAFPAAIRLLPRPGAWMETFKQAMAFLLYATVAYLVWVLAAQVDGDGFLSLLLGLVVVGIAGWVLGHWGTLSRSRGVRRTAQVVTAVLLVGGFVYGMPKTGPAAPDDITWEPWSAARVAELVKEGRPIYADFTARWCVTCQANKKLVFGSGEVRAFFAKHRIATLRGDWTNRDGAITAELQRWNRSAVPFNLAYLPGAEPIPLPEVLTAGIVLDAFASLEK
ncbi:MAG TPA: protein-disulfide reductase DsbD domain-containing protein [Opitutaceae bacterium]